MKNLYCLLLCLFCTVAFAQETTAELAQKVFAACLKQDENAFLEFCPTEKIVGEYFKASAPDMKVTPDMAQKAAAYQKDRALTGFRVFQEAAAFFAIDGATVVPGTTENIENDDELLEGDKKIGVARSTVVTLYLTSSEKKYAFVIPDAIQHGGRYYLGNRPVMLHELEE